MFENFAGLLIYLTFVQMIDASFQVLEDLVPLSELYTKEIADRSLEGKRFLFSNVEEQTGLMLFQDEIMQNSSIVKTVRLLYHKHFCTHDDLNVKTKDKHYKFFCCGLHFSFIVLSIDSIGFSFFSLSMFSEQTVIYIHSHAFRRSC